MHIIKHTNVLPLVKKYISGNPVIVEVGAFKGHDTIRMAQQFPTASIHAFEPVPELYDALVNATTSYAQIKTYRAAVSNHDGIAPLYIAHKSTGATTQASSLQKPKERLMVSPIKFPTIIDVPTITLNTWAQQTGIDHIDLLWLDTQGHEMIILETIKETLLPRTRMIYTEVAFIEAYENQMHTDQIITWLAKAGFTAIAQDFENPPTWFFGNILFIRNDALQKN
jgi:FkbM family methyltransferase